MKKTLAYAGIGVTAVVVVGGWAVILSKLPVENPKGAMMLGIVAAVFNGLVGIGWLLASAFVRGWRPVVVALCLFANSAASLLTMRLATKAHDDAIEPPKQAPAEALR